MISTVNSAQPLIATHSSLLGESKIAKSKVSNEAKVGTPWQGVKRRSSQSQPAQREEGWQSGAEDSPKAQERTGPLNRLTMVLQEGLQNMPSGSLNIAKSGISMLTGVKDLFGMGLSGVQTLKTAYQFFKLAKGKFDVTWEEYHEYLEPLLAKAGIDVKIAPGSDKKQSKSMHFLINGGSLFTLEVGRAGKAEVKTSRVFKKARTRSALEEIARLDRKVDKLQASPLIALPAIDSKNEMNALFDRFIEKSSYLATMTLIKEKLFRLPPKDPQFYKQILKTAEETSESAGIMVHAAERKAVMDHFCHHESIRYPLLAKFLFNIIHVIMHDIIEGTTLNVKDEIIHLFENENLIYDFFVYELGIMNIYMGLNLALRKEHLFRTSGRSDKKIYGDQIDIEKFLNDELLNPKNLGGRSVSQWWNALHQIIAHRFFKIKPLDGNLRHYIKQHHALCMSNIHYRKAYNHCLMYVVDWLIKPLFNLFIKPLNGIRDKLLRTCVGLVLDRMQVFQSPINSLFAENREFELARYKGLVEMLKSINDEQIKPKHGADQEALSAERVNTQKLRDALRNILAQANHFLNTDDKNTDEQMGQYERSASNYLNQFIDTYGNEAFIDAGMNILEKLFLIMGRKEQMYDKFNFVFKLCLGSFNPVERSTDPIWLDQAIAESQNEIQDWVEKISMTAVDDVVTNIIINRAQIAEKEMLKNFKMLNQLSTTLFYNLPMLLYNTAQRVDLIANKRIDEYNRSTHELFNAIKEIKQFTSAIKQLKLEFKNNKDISRHGNKENKEYFENAIALIAERSFNTTNRLEKLLKINQDLDYQAKALPHLNRLFETMPRLEELQQGHLTALDNQINLLKQHTYEDISYFQEISSLDLAQKTLDEQFVKFKTYQPMKNHLDSLQPEIKRAESLLGSYRNLAKMHIVLTDFCNELQEPEKLSFDILSKRFASINRGFRSFESLWPETKQHEIQDLINQIHKLPQANPRTSTAVKLKGVISYTFQKNQVQNPADISRLLHLKILVSLQTVKPMIVDAQKGLKKQLVEKHLQINRKMATFPLITDPNITVDVERIKKAFSNETFSTKSSYSSYLQSASLAICSIQISLQTLFNHNRQSYTNTQNLLSKSVNDFSIKMQNSLSQKSTQFQTYYRFNLKKIRECRRDARTIGHTISKPQIFYIGDLLENAKTLILSRTQKTVLLGTKTFTKPRHLQILGTYYMGLKAIVTKLSPK